MVWSSPETLRGKGPAPRFDHGGTIFNGKLVIFGGRDNRRAPAGGLPSARVCCRRLGAANPWLPARRGAAPAAGRSPQGALTALAVRARRCEALWELSQAIVLTGPSACCSTMYKDIHVLDVDTLTWVDDPKAVPPEYLVEITNHQCSAIESVPHYKLFCIAGKTGTMSYRRAPGLTPGASLRCRAACARPTCGSTA